MIWFLTLHRQSGEENWDHSSRTMANKLCPQGALSYHACQQKRYTSIYCQLFEAGESSRISHSPVSCIALRGIRECHSAKKARSVTLGLEKEAAFKATGLPPRASWMRNQLWWGWGCAWSRWWEGDFWSTAEVDRSAVLRKNISHMPMTSELWSTTVSLKWAGW